MHQHVATVGAVVGLGQDGGHRFFGGTVQAIRDQYALAPTGPHAGQQCGDLGVARKGAVDKKVLRDHVVDSGDESFGFVTGYGADIAHGLDGQALEQFNT
jgi:hypothetical protein